MLNPAVKGATRRRGELTYRIFAERRNPTSLPVMKKWSIKPLHLLSEMKVRVYNARQISCDGRLPFPRQMMRIFPPYKPMATVTQFCRSEKTL
jgi:hypothetical protein